MNTPASTCQELKVWDMFHSLRGNVVRTDELGMWNFEDVCEELWPPCCRIVATEVGSAAGDGQHLGAVLCWPDQVKMG